jgi:ribosomal protein L16/L10AE
MQISIGVVVQCGVLIEAGHIEAGRIEACRIVHLTIQCWIN